MSAFAVGSDSTRSGAGQRITCGLVTLDPEGWAVKVNGRDVTLTVSEFLLLHELMLNASRFLDRASLARVLQSAPGFGNRAEPASLRSVDIVISRLRRKLQAAGCDAIQTMRQIGYRLVPASEPTTRAG